MICTTSSGSLCRSIGITLSKSPLGGPCRRHCSNALLARETLIFQAIDIEQHQKIGHCRARPLCHERQHSLHGSHRGRPLGTAVSAPSSRRSRPSLTNPIGEFDRCNSVKLVQMIALDSRERGFGRLLLEDLFPCEGEMRSDHSRRHGFARPQLTAIR